MNERQLQIQRHHDKWKRQNKEVNNRQKQPNFIGKPQDNAHSYAIKLIQQLDTKISKPVNHKNIEQQCESNICCICLQLMIPPYIPYILFPCGHNICKICLFHNGDQKRDVYKQRVMKCPLCKNNISDYGQNRNLMKLICTYTDNKNLLQKQLDKQIQDQVKTDNITKLRIKCEILQGQRKCIKAQLDKYRKQKRVLDEVIDKLNNQRRRNQNESNALQEQGRLIHRFVNQKKQQIEEVRNKIEQTSQKKKILMRTLQPLLKYKQKVEMNGAKQLIARK